jgi:hypothetical protein
MYSYELLVVWGRKAIARTTDVVYDCFQNTAPTPDRVSASAREHQAP